MKFPVPFLLAAFLFHGLTACGSKGPLVLPEAKLAQGSVATQHPVK